MTKEFINSIYKIKAGVMRLSGQSRYKAFHEFEFDENGKMVVKFDEFDQGCVSVLNSILVDSSIEIVVSSDWRCWKSLSEMGEFYLEQRVCRKPVDYTPQIVRSHRMEENRVLEIMSWLDQHPSVNQWVAVDDLDMRAGLKNFVWVNCSELGIKQSGVREEIFRFF